jgi:spermidine synthase
LHHVVFGFFFLSGFSSLVFEVLWERSLARIFGTTSLALSTLLTAFMAGLALGAWLGGKYADRVRRPLRAYGLLEGGIGLYALLVPILLGVLPDIYGSMFDRLFDHPVAFSLLRFVTVFAILVVPTTLMGASLPFVSQWVSRVERLFQGRVGWLYATNTLGACAGCLLAGFAFLPTLGLSSTNYLFAAVNVALCVVVVVADATFLRDVAPDENFDEEAAAALGKTIKPDQLGEAARVAIVAGFGIAGLVSMTYQVLWTRAYVIVLGSSTYSFTLILTAFLMGLGGGGAIASSFVERIRRPLAWLAGTQLGLVILAAATFRVLDDLPAVLFSRMREEIGAPEEIYLFQFLLVGALVFLPIALQGATFPLVVRALVTRRESAGLDVGRAYSVNTIGAIGGSFLAGFVLLPVLGLRVAMTVALGANLIVALTWAALEVRDRMSRRKALTFAALAIAATVAVVLGPSVNKVALTRGMFRVYWARELFDPEKFARDDPELVYYSDGVTATTSVEKRGELVTLKANGKPEASDGADMATQILVALLPMMMRTIDQPMGGEKVAMIGFGSGVTAGAALQWPLESLEVVEIEPAMLEASHFFDHVNHKPLEDDRTKVIATDGRNFLEYSNDQYDVIISEPSNPWIAGVASLFTVEHFRRAKEKLADGGVFGQWVQLYEINPTNVKRIFATFHEAFPHVQAYSSMPKGTDLILIGSDRPLPLPSEGFARAWANDITRAELRRAGVSSAWDPYGLMFMSQSEIEAFSEGARINTDDNGLLEFEAPRDLIRYDVGQKYFAERYFRTEDYGDPRAHLNGWPDAWQQSQRGELAIATWKAGKRTLADDLIGAAVDRTTALAAAASRLGTRDLVARIDGMTTTEKYLAVRHAEELDLDEAMVQAWPSPGSELHGLVTDPARHDKHLQAMMYLESDGEPPRSGFDGEKGLVYAWVLARRKYYRHALRQLEGLGADYDPAIVNSLPYRLLTGWVYFKRRKYEEAFEAYLAAGASLLGD